MTTQEIKEVITAYEEGKKIEVSNKGENKWVEPVRITWNFDFFDYRVKPESPQPEYVPYESAEEFLQAQREHGWYIKMDGGYSPACDDTDDDDMYYVAPTEIASNIIIFAIIDDSDKHDDLISIHYADLVNYQWADGTPCGKLKGGEK